MGINNKFDIDSINRWDCFKLALSCHTFSRGTLIITLWANILNRPTKEEQVMSQLKQQYSWSWKYNKVGEKSLARRTLIRINRILSTLSLSLKEIKLSSETISSRLLTLHQTRQSSKIHTKLIIISLGALSVMWSTILLKLISRKIGNPQLPR